MMNRGHIHNFTYLLKTDEKTQTYTGQVIEIPGVITQGDTPEDIKKSIAILTKKHLIQFEDIHKEVLANPIPKLKDSGYGIIVKTESFKIKC